MSIAYVQFEKLATGNVIGCMYPVTETRLIRLQMLVKKHNDSLADLNEAIGLVRTDATLSQIRTKAPHSKTGKPRVMGDDMARKIEERLSLELGWMDTPPTYAEMTGESDPRSDLWKVMEDMTPSDLYRAAAILAALKSTPYASELPIEHAAETNPLTATSAPAIDSYDMVAVQVGESGVKLHQYVEIKPTSPQHIKLQLTPTTRRKTSHRATPPKATPISDYFEQMAVEKNACKMLKTGKSTTRGAAIAKATQNQAKAAHKSKA